MCKYNSTTVHILGYKARARHFHKKGKNDEKRLKKGKNENGQLMHENIRKFFAIFDKDTLIHITIVCLKGLKYALHCVKYTKFI